LRLSPVLLGLALHRWCGGIFALDPIATPPSQIRRNQNGLRTLRAQGAVVEKVAPMSPTETNGQLQGLLLRKTLLLIASLVPAIAITPGARADICFEYGSGGGTSVAKGAKVPPVNTCIRVTPVDLGARLGVATGSICQVFLAVQRSRSGRRLPRVRAAVCRRQYPVGGMLGPCEAQILRGASGNRLPRRGRSIETHRRALRDRGDHPRPNRQHTTERAARGASDRPRTTES